MDILRQYFIAILVTGIINGSLGIFVFLKGFNKRLNQTFALYSLSLFLWSVFEALGITRQNESLALVLWRINHIGVIFIPIFLTHFVFVLLDIKGRRRKLIPVSYAIACIFLILDATPLLISEVVPKFSFRYFINPGPLYYIFFLMWIGWTIYGNIELFKEYFRTSGYRKNQMQYFCWSLLFSYIGGVPNFFPVFNIEIPILMPYGTYAISLYAFVTAYAIVKYRFMNIRVVLTRAGIFAIVYLLVLGFPLYLGYKYNSWMYATWSMAILASVGPFVFISLSRQAEARLLAEDLRKYGILKRFTSTLGKMRDIGLERLLKLIVYRLVKTMEVSCGAIYLNDEEANACVARASHILKGPQSAGTVDLSQENAFIRFIIAYHKEFLLEDVQRLASEAKPGNNKPLNGQPVNNSHSVDEINYSEVIARMQQLNARLVIPSFLDKELLGFLVLGEKVSGRPYSEADIEVLLTLSGQASLAILNALFTIKLRDRERELADASRIVEIGNLAASTGHQLGNVLNNIMNAGYAILDNDAIFDAIKNNPPAKASFEKIVDVIITNAGDGDQIIDEIRSYSRREGDRHYALVGLKEVLDKTLRMLYIQINKFQNIDIAVNIAPDVSPVFASAIGLQNVFVNMFNNAYDSIQEMKEYVKLHPESGMNNYKGKIEVTITYSKGSINIHLIDNGQGMTLDVARKLFSPHYTTKGSSDKRKQMKLSGGSGIGLFTIRFLIKEYGGTIKLVKTEHLKGADFLIQLPVPKND